MHLRTFRLFRMLRAALGVVLFSLTTACRWETELPSDATTIHVDPSRELLITDAAMVSGDLASNRNAGPFSFRHVVETLPLRADGTLGWLTAWSAQLAAEGDPDRARRFDENVTCRWLRATESNACDARCSTCKGRHLALETAPLRLTAIVNRTDLSVMPDRRSDGGEGRLVFGFTDGPGDAPGSPTLPLAVIFEYAQPGSALEWTRRWHELGTTADFGAALTALTETFVGSGSLAQIRTADASTGPLVFHQFELTNGNIVVSRVRNTPDWQSMTPASLFTYASDHAEAIEDGTAVLPNEWLASFSSPAVDTPSWVATHPQREGLLRGTCAGCHARSESGFHLNPDANSGARPSSFLSDSTQERDELRRRVEWMQLTLARAL